MPLAAPKVDVPCLAYCPRDQSWYHGVVTGVSDTHIEIKDAITDEVRTVELPLSDKSFRYDMVDEAEAAPPLSEPHISMLHRDFEALNRPANWVGAYSPVSRKARVERFFAKKNQRVWD